MVVMYIQKWRLDLENHENIIRENKTKQNRKKHLKNKKFNAGAGTEGIVKKNYKN